MEGLVSFSSVEQRSGVAFVTPLFSGLLLTLDEFTSARFVSLLADFSRMDCYGPWPHIGNVMFLCLIAEHNGCSRHRGELGVPA